MKQKIKDLLDEALKTRPQQTLFNELRAVACPRVAMMIIDSAMKGIELESLADTLLVRKDRFNLELENAVIALEKIVGPELYG